jgi:two-component system NtrC family sensor kinase
MGQQPARILTVMMAACVVLPAALFGYAAWSVDRDLHHQAERSISITLDVLVQHTLKVFQTAELGMHAMNLLTAGLSEAQIRAREPQLHADLKDLASGLAEIQSFWIIGQDGKALASDRISPMPDIDVSDRDYYRAFVAADPGVYVGPVQEPKLGGAPFFSVSRRRTSPDGGFAGELVVSLLPTDFERFYSQLNPERVGLYQMIRSDGAILVRFPQPDTPVSFLDPAKAPLLKALAQHPEGGRFTAVSSVDGIARVSGYRAVPGYPVVVVAGVQIDTIRAAWLSTLEGYLIFGVPATLALQLALWVALRRTRGFLKEAERRQAAEAALARTQRMEALGQLTGGVAHDFNNLLTVVNGAAEILRLSISDARAERPLAMIESAVRRGATLTRQLLTFASRQALAVEVIDLTQHLPRFKEMLRGSLRGDIEVIVDVPDVPCMVKADPGELELALLNIAVNARDAMPHGGRLSLRVRPVTLNSDPSADRLRGEFVAVEVKDTGAGIDPAVLARVFEPFFTTKECGKGSGLGLSQVYGFARQSGGTVTIASEPGGGTTVTLYLPGTTEMPQAAPARAATNHTGGNGRRVLVVEDNPDVSEILRGLLLDLGYAVTVASSARAALDRLNAPGRFDLVISDIMMPGEMNGIDLAQELRRRDGGLPVLLTSGYSAGAEMAMREGFLLLRKPYDLAQLREMVEAAMRQTAAVEPGLKAAE